MQLVMWTYFWENMVPTVTTAGLSHNYRKLLQPIFWDLAIAARGLLGMVRKNVTQNQGPIGDLQFRWKSKTIKLGPLRLLIFNPSLSILTPQNWLFWGPNPYYTGSNPSIGGSNDP